MALQPTCNRGNSSLDTAMQSFFRDAAVSDAVLVDSISLAQLSPSDNSILNLPSEILLEVFSLLEKPDLRSVRLASKSFSQLAVESLFEKVYISPCEQDVELFTKIAQQPNLARCIRTFTYDVSEFHVDRIAEYRTKWISYFRRLLRRRPEIVLPCTINEIRRLLDFPHDLRRAMNHHPIIKLGYLEYSRRQEEQEQFKISRQFLDRLCAGLAKMTRLREVAFEYKWKEHPAELMISWSRTPLRFSHPVGSLARNWNPYTLKPSRPRFTHLMCAFTTMLNALSITGQSIKEINFAHSLQLPDCFFDSKSVFSKAYYKLNLSTIEKLRKLTVSIKPTFKWDGPPGIKSHMDLLESDLFNAPNLKHLRLMFDKYNGIEEQYISLSEVFPKKRYPKSLVSLHLEGIRSSEEELSVFFQHLPELRHLTLEKVDIEEGCWKDVMKSVIKSTALLSFRMRDLMELATGDYVSLASLYEP